MINIKFLKTIIAVLIFFPVLTFAECNKDGFTIVFVNGIFGNEESAINNSIALSNEYYKKGKNVGVEFITGFNQSHVGGADDLLRSTIQAYGYNGVDYNLTNILSNLQKDLKTQKVLLVGHSQGSFYTNAAYEYLIGHGMPKESVGVYNIGTPADYVAGNGKYLNSRTDDVINNLVANLAKLSFAHIPLAPNIDLKVPDGYKDNSGGHSFNDIYLKFASNRIIGDIDLMLENLKAVNDYPQSPNGDCFIAPPKDFIYHFQDTTYEVVDNTPKYMPTSPFHSAEELASFGRGIFSKINNFFANLKPEFFVTSTLPGYSIEESTPPKDPIENPTEDLSSFTGTGEHVLTEQEKQDLIDDLKERIDFLNQQINLLSGQQNNQQAEQDNEIKEDEEENENQQENQIETQNQDYHSTGSIVYPKVLISEVQEASATDEKEEFVELYNPNDKPVSLTGWYLQKKTATGKDWSTFAKSDLFDGKAMSPKSYFLIARQGYFAGFGDVYTEGSITDNNSFALKNPNGEIVDKLGFGTAQDPETSASVSPVPGKSIGRKVLSDGSEQDTDNNFADFELQKPTLKEKNITYTDSEPDPTLKKILINEIQISGLTDEKEEFVELYNPNNEDVDLTGWYMQRKTKDGTSYSSYAPSSLFDGKTIKTKDYFLIGREMSSFATLADAITTYSLGDYSADGGSTLVLKNKDKNISDKVGFGLATEHETSPAKNPVKGNSIQRVWDKTLNQPQDTDNNSADFEIFNQTTPRAEAPKYYLFDNFTFSENTTLKKSLSPYLFKNNSTVNEGVILTIEPGTVIKFDSEAMLTVNGTVKAIGTDADKIVFTSLRDDDCGISPVCGDTNGDGNTTLPNRGNWRGLDFTEKSTNSEFEYVKIRYGGANLSSLGSVLRIKNCSVSVKNSTIENNLNRGIYVVNGSAIIDSDNFLNQIDSDFGSSFNAVAIQVDGGSGSILNNYFNGNDRGIILSFGSGGEATDFLVKNNNFESNYLAVDLLTFNGPTFEANQATKNNFDAIKINTDVSVDTTLNPAGISYLVNRVFYVPENVTLTINPGVIMAFQSWYDGMKVDGTLKALGAADNKIIFRAYYYDRSWVKPGNWMGLYFSDKSKDSAFENVEIYFGGSFNNTNGYGAAIKVEKSAITIKNSYIHDNANSGLWLINSPSLVDGVSFLNHRAVGEGRPQAKAIFIEGGSPEVKNCHLQAQTYGIYEKSWTNPDTSEVVLPTPNLHIADLEDAEKNNFADSDINDVYVEP